MVNSVCCSVVVQLLFSCCPVVVQCFTEQQLKKNRTWTAQEYEVLWHHWGRTGSLEGWWVKSKFSILFHPLWGSKVGYSGGGRESLCGFLFFMLQIDAKIPKGVSSPRDFMIIYEKSCGSAALLGFCRLPHGMSAALCAWSNQRHLTPRVRRKTYQLLVTGTTVPFTATLMKEGS